MTIDNAKRDATNTPGLPSKRVPKPRHYMPHVELVRVTWGAVTEFVSTERGTWVICNMGLVSHVGMSGPDYGDIVLTTRVKADVVVVRAPMMSVMSRRPEGRPYADPSLAVAVMNAMTSTWPLRITCAAGQAITVAHEFKVRRPESGADLSGRTVNIENELEPEEGFSPSSKRPFVVELAGCLSMEASW